MFLISLVHHHHPALLHREVLILDRLLTFLTTFSTLALKPPFSQRLSLHSHLSLPQAHRLKLWPLVVWQSLAAILIDKCGRLGLTQPIAGFWAHYNIVLLTYLLTYLLNDNISSVFHLSKCLAHSYHIISLKREVDMTDPHGCWTVGTSRMGLSGPSSTYQMHQVLVYHPVTIRAVELTR